MLFGTYIIFIFTILIWTHLLLNPEITTDEYTSYNHKELLTYDYTTHLKPNPIYGKTTLPANLYYPLLYTDSLLVNFKYKFNGQVPTTIKGKYKVNITLEGYTIRNEKIQSLWRKKYPSPIIVPVNITKENFSSDRSFSINIDPYLNFIELLKDDNISSQCRLIIRTDLDLVKSNEFGEFNDPYQHEFIVPLTNTFINIDSELKKEYENPITATTTTTTPLSLTSSIIFALFLILCLTVIICLHLLTEPIVKSLKEKIAISIFKKYGTRLIGTLEDPDRHATNPIILKSMEDLIRLSDELIKPIFYHAEKEIKDIKEFYLLTEGKIYIYPFRVDDLSNKPIHQSKSKKASSLASE